MNNRGYLIALICLALLSGFAYYIFNNEWIVIKYNNTQGNVVFQKSKKRNYVLWYWHNDKWNFEAKELVDLEANKAKTVEYLVSSWLGLLDEEQVVDKKVSIQSVMLDSTQQEVFISLDRNPFLVNSSIFAKWYWVEGLVKTLRINIPNLQKVYVLVHHQVLDDLHLDFSQGWPISGFIDI